MVKDLKNYSFDYLTLFILLGIGVTLYFVYRDNAVMEQLIFAGMGLSYVLWGIIHHHHADKITTKIVLEYALVAVFGFLVVNSLLVWR